MDEKSIFQNAQVLSTLKIETEKEHPVITYLKSKAIKIPKDAKITSFNPAQSDSAPSRARGNLQTDKMSSELDRKGVSGAGAEKLEKTQVSMAA